MFRALVLHKDGDTVRPVVEDVEPERLPEGDVLLDVAYSSLNYKDGLAVTNRGKIVRADYPFVPGIDLAGTVLVSASPEFAEGDRVVLTGWGTGEERWGGFAERARAAAEHLVRLPDGMDLKEAMLVGTAGFTAMLSVLALEEMGVSPEDGDVVVTGASGGVGSTAVALLSRAGYRVVASTGTASAHDILRRLGAAEILGREVLGQGAQRPLDTARWAGAVDSVGGDTLEAILSQTRRHGCVAACGLAGSHTLDTTVFPFILRGVVLYGVDSNTAPRARREQAWSRLAAAVRDGAFAGVETTIPLEEVIPYSEKIVRGETVGRVVVDVKA
ncbi:MAG: MDR family oxidoreductase [Rubricoccaceae bacterium]|nr:MDR family oxidoreductase [Rubricoccaceae bacterium]